jgi:serine/threonine-protein kinase
MQLRIGDTFAGYRVLRLLGSGGMGEVYLVQHPRLPRQEALKVLRPDVSSDPSFRERFIREADLAAGLRHPHIVGIHDRGEHDGQLWIAMDYIDGTDAAQQIQQHYPAGMPTELAIPIITAIASALDHAHKKCLLHRDVKPANIIVADLDSDDRRVFLADFGIARPLDDIDGITTTNTTVGTVAYAAPEQLMGEQLDGRADQYALAATAYQLLSGLQLFPNSKPAAVISRHLNSPPPHLGDSRTELAVLDGVLGVALAKTPEDRFGNCTDFAHALSDALSSSASAIAPTMPAKLSPRTAHAQPAPLRAMPDGSRGDWRRWAIIVSSLAVVVVIVVVALRSHRVDDHSSRTAEPPPTSSAPTTLLSQRLLSRR